MAERKKLNVRPDPPPRTGGATRFPTMANLNEELSVARNHLSHWRDVVDENPTPRNRETLRQARDMVLRKVNGVKGRTPTGRRAASGRRGRVVRR